MVAGVERHVAPDIQVEPGAAVVRVDRDRPAGAKNGQIERCIRARRDFHDRVDAVRRHTSDRLRRIGLPVVHDVVRDRPPSLAEPLPHR